MKSIEKGETMMARNITTILALLSLLFAACGDDDDDDGSGGTGGSGGSAGEDQDAGTGGDGGSGGSGDAATEDPEEACIERQHPSVSDECADCRCDKCLDEFTACGEDDACVAIGQCADETGCWGLACYTPEACMDVFDENGGPVSPSVDLLLAIADCITAECNTNCGGAAAGEPIPATFTVTDGTDPVEGAEACLLDTTDCATSNASGELSLDVPALSEVALTVVAPDHFPLLYGTVTGPRDASFTVTLTPTADIEAQADAAGVTLDDTKGIIGFAVVGPAGTTAELSPASGTLVYTDANEDPDPSLTGTIDAVVGGGIFWNVEPGDYDLSYSHPDTTCQRSGVSTWEGSTEGAARVTVVAGHYSGGGHMGTCDPLP
jgi:hypothetical protein